MKKLLSVLLICIIAFSMVACGGDKDNQGKDSSKASKPVSDKVSDKNSDEANKTPDEENNTDNTPNDDDKTSGGNTEGGDTPVVQQPASPPYLLDGKTYVFLGSSVTYGSASNGWSMADYIKSRHNCTVVKWAVSGTTLAVQTYGNSYVERMEQNMASQAKCDHLIVQLSTNDAVNSLRLGKISDSKNPADFDTTTVIGAMEYIIATAKEKWGCEVSFYTGTKFEHSTYRNMVNAVLKLKDKWGIGVLDLYNDPEMNAVSQEKRKEYMADDVHPTRKGYEEWWGPKFEHYLQQYK